MLIKTNYLTTKMNTHNGKFATHVAGAFVSTQCLILFWNAEICYSFIKTVCIAIEGGPFS